MDKVKFTDLLHGLLDIQNGCRNYNDLWLDISVDIYTQPSTIITATLIGSGKKQHSYTFSDDDDSQTVWGQLDGLHKRFRRKPDLRDIVKSLKKDIKKKN